MDTANTLIMILKCDLSTSIIDAYVCMGLNIWLVRDFLIVKIVTAKTRAIKEKHFNSFIVLYL